MEKPESKSPMGAVIRSALLPGLGQWYNEQRIKALIVFGGEAALVGNIIYYRQKAREAEIEDNRLFYEDVQSRFTWILAAVHLLNMLDAFVDAHLFDFDAGPDLSVGMIPEPCYGVRISLNIPLSRMGD